MIDRKINSQCRNAQRTFTAILIELLRIGRRSYVTIERIDKTPVPSDPIGSSGYDRRGSNKMCQNKMIECARRRIAYEHSVNSI